MKRMFKGTLVAIAILLTGCGVANKKEKKPDNKVSDKNEDSEYMDIAKIEYKTVNGMIWGADFSIVVTKDKIESANYFDDKKSEYRTIKNTRVKEKNWRELVKAIYDIKPELIEVEINNIEETSEIDEVECTDGPNYSIFKITWILADGTEKCVQYFQPPSSTFQTVRDLLDKIANITG